MRNKIIIIITVFILLFSTNYETARAEGTENTDSKGFEEKVEEIFDGLNTKDIEKYLDELIPPFGENGDLKNFVKSVMSGKSENYDSLFKYLFSIVTYGFREKLPSFVSLFILIIFAALVKLISPSDKPQGASELANYAIFTAIICIVSGVVYGIISNAENTLEKMSRFTEAIYPIVLTLTIACGASSSAATVTPTALFVSDTVIIIVKNVVFPIIIFMLAIAIASNMNKSIKLKGLFGFLSSFMKWGIGLFTVVFSLFLGINGLNSGAIDGLGYKTAKYAVGSTLPLVGGVVGDGLNMMIASAAIIKNAFGMLAVFVIFSVAIIPIIETIVLSLVLKLIAAVTEPFSDPRIGEFISGGITVINFIVAALVIVSFMYIISFVAIIGCAGYLFS